MFTLKDEFEKTITFFIIDILAVFVFTWMWFEYYDEEGTRNAFDESIQFTIAMQIFFFVYYFLFDAFWEHLQNPR